tara:strand:- start:3 stop:107 length:105 start_codon:yes stop_codon:yes gene_type:complete
MTIGYGLGLLAIGSLLILIVAVGIFLITNPKEEE